MTEKHNRTKRYRFISRTELLFLLFAAALLVQMFTAAASPAADAAGAFTLAEGTVDILRGGTPPAVAAKVGDKVFQGDAIRTKSASRAEITLADKTVVRIAQRSRIDISEYVSTGTGTKGTIKLPRGKVEAIVDKDATNRISTSPQANRFEIHTPNAVAGVRGTDFFVAYERNMTLSLVKTGLVCVNNIFLPEAVVCMQPNYITTVYGKNRPEQPRPATDADIRYFESDIFLKKHDAASGRTRKDGVAAGSAEDAETVKSVGDSISGGLLTGPGGQDSSAGGGYYGVANLTETPVRMTDIPVSQPITEYIASAANPVPDIIVPVDGSGQFSANSSITANGDLEVFSTVGQAGVGRGRIALDGAYTGTPQDLWTLTATATQGPGLVLTADYTGTQWSGNNLSATAAGFWVDTTPFPPQTGIYLGETRGTFDPAAATWQSVTSGNWVETIRYLQMVKDPAGVSQLQQLNIPVVEVGKTNLSGALAAGKPGAIDFISVLMNNVSFFAPSTGQKPLVWATDSISGQFSFTNGNITAATITSAVNSITVANGSGISADVSFNQWNTATNAWTANITNGTGTLNNGSYNGAVNFRGAAAGTISGGTSGTISGTAAGIAK